MYTLKHQSFSFLSLDAINLRAFLKQKCASKSFGEPAQTAALCMLHLEIGNKFNLVPCKS